MTSSKPDIGAIDLFAIPVVYLDGDLTIIQMNKHFQSLFGDHRGQPITHISDDFNERKFTRRLAAAESYQFAVVPAHEKRAQYTVTLKQTEDGFVGFATDTSASAKSEAMLASYSDLIERQNREIKAKTEQINRWRARIENELDQAATVQDLLVPKQILTPTLDSRCEPLQELSGDFHEMVTHADGSATFISGDVAGKGIYAAIMLAQTLTAFRAVADLPSLSELVCAIVTMLDDRFPDGLFVALTLVRQSADKNHVEILNLGNPDALLLDETGIVAQIPSAGPAIGILPASIYADLDSSQHTLTGRQLYVFSDGVLDINLGDGQRRFEDSAAVGQYLHTHEAQHGAATLASLTGIVRNHTQIDDVTIARFTAAPLNG